MFHITILFYCFTVILNFNTKRETINLFMTKKSEIGKSGEDMACEYLVNKRFTIIERNFRKKWGEIDIIAKDLKGVLVFVEVKTIQQSLWQVIQQSGESQKYDLDNYAPNSLWQAIRQYGNAAMIKKMRQKIGWKESSQIMPEENLTAAKLKKLQRTASLYVGFNLDLIKDELGWRIDLVAITIINGVPQIKHFENI